MAEPRLIGPFGGVEHLRPLLGRGTELGSGELVWLTDRTPHESLPLRPGTPRQFFRLVSWTSKTPKTLCFECFTRPWAMGHEP